MRKKTQYIVVNEIYKTIYCGYPQKRAWNVFETEMMKFEKLDLAKIEKILNLLDEYSFEMYLVHQLVILGPFSLLSLTENIVVNFLIMLFSICILTIILKKLEKAVDRRILRS